MAKRLSIYQRYVRDANKLKAISEKRGGQLYGNIFSEKQFKSQFIATKNTLQDKLLKDKLNFKVRDSEVIKELVKSHKWMSDKEAIAQARALSKRGIWVSQDELVSGKNVIEFTDKRGIYRRMDSRLKDIIDKESQKYEAIHGGTKGLRLYISQEVFGSK